MQPVLLLKTVSRNAMVACPPRLLGNLAHEGLFGGQRGSDIKLAQRSLIGTRWPLRGLKPMEHRATGQHHPQESLRERHLLAGHCVRSLSEHGHPRAEACHFSLVLGSTLRSSVADLAGFSGLNAFSRWFRGRIGASPSGWRAGRSV